ncbi:hypothetical protein EMCRGX_G032888 [Ephydatia muelleri]
MPLKFLWVDNINIQLPRLVIMHFTRVSASPLLLNATIRSHVESYRGEDLLFVDKFNRSIYVDYLTFGAKTEDKPMDYSQSQRYEHQVSRVPAPHSELIICEYKSCTKNTLGEKLDRPECVKVLIVKWKPVHDVLICDLSDLYKAVSKMKPTKRNFIGLTARAYDPLGFLSQDASNCCSRTSV